MNNIGAYCHREHSPVKRLSTFLTAPVLKHALDVIFDRFGSGKQSLAGLRVNASEKVVNNIFAGRSKNIAPRAELGRCLRARVVVIYCDDREQE